MFAHSQGCASALRRMPASVQRATSLILAAGFAAFLLAGCSAGLSAIAPRPDPADPNARVSAVGYRSGLGAYRSQRPVEPRPWREQNDRVAPRKEGE